jgi:hypothetical protein
MAQCATMREHIEACCHTKADGSDEGYGAALNAATPICASPKSHVRLDQRREAVEHARGHSEVLTIGDVVACQYSREPAVRPTTPWASSILRSAPQWPRNLAEIPALVQNLHEQTGVPNSTTEEGRQEQPCLIIHFRSSEQQRCRSSTILDELQHERWRGSSRRTRTTCVVAVD